MAKMGFSERLYLKYLQTKFKTLGMLSAAIAGKMAFDLFCTPYPKYKKRKAPAIFHQAKKWKVTTQDNINLHGFEWTPANKNGQTVLIVHGYASFGYKFESYIQPLLKMGFRVLIMDAPGHGLSEGKYINIPVYMNALEEAIKVQGPVDHFIGHSLGGITLALMAEKITAPEKHKFVLIAPATKTTTTFDNYFNMMHLSEDIRKAFIEFVLSKTPHTLDYFEADRAIQDYKGPLLWVHDRDDLVCPYKDVILFQKKAKENIKFLITNELGHNKVYKNQGVIDQIMVFLDPSS